MRKIGRECLYNAGLRLSYRLRKILIAGEKALGFRPHLFGVSARARQFRASSQQIRQGVFPVEYWSSNHHRFYRRVMDMSRFLRRVNEHSCFGVEVAELCIC
jgi:hypothetical protein